MANAAALHMPAPNAYDGDCKSAVLKKSASYGFGTSRRPQSQQTKRQVPGPGHYPIKTSVGTESQGKSLAFRHNPGKTSNEFNPGPGSYNSDYRSAVKSSPSFGMGTSKRQELGTRSTRNNPPPGSHNPDYTISKQKQASWSFGSSVRQPLSGKNHGTPGAGTYPRHKGSEGPAFNMGLKLDNQSSIGQYRMTQKGKPGPGAHEPNYKAAKKALPAFSMISRHPD